MPCESAVMRPSRIALSRHAESFGGQSDLWKGDGLLRMSRSRDRRMWCEEYAELPAVGLGVEASTHCAAIREAFAFSFGTSEILVLPKHHTQSGHMTPPSEKLA